MMFCRPNTATLLLARLKIIVFITYTNFENCPFFAKIWIFTPLRRNFESIPNFAKILHTSFFHAIATFYH